MIPFFVHSTLFDPPALLWLGLGVALPNTLDWYPLLPWAGVVLIGLGLARLPGVLARLTSPGRWRASSGPARAVCFAGRHSLAALSYPPAHLVPPRLGGRRLGPICYPPRAEPGLQRLSRRLRARLRRRRTDGGRMRNLVPVRRRRDRAFRRGGATRRRRARHSAKGQAQADGGRLHDAVRRIRRNRVVVNRHRYFVRFQRLARTFRSHGNSQADPPILILSRDAKHRVSKRLSGRRRCSCALEHPSRSVACGAAPQDEGVVGSYFAS